jgi:predicted RNA-binding Zn-ribbon protein involved in translation (DUF1610 family)
MVTEPQSMDELIYFTRRAIGNGKAMAWVYRKECPKCHKAKMGKPVDPKTGSAKIRAKEYTCPECGFTEEKVEHEESLTLEAKYTCPHCGKEGEGTTPYKRKTFEGVPSYVVVCEHCSGKIGISKKMKEGKKK